MKELISFDYMGNGVRTIEIDGEPWFVAADVARVLGYSNTSDAISKHCKGGRKTRYPSSGGLQETTIIPERDVYRLIMRSRLPSAEAFEEWVVGEVLPTIRKTGKYVTTRAKSKEVRNAFTAVLKQHGYDKPVEYATTTKHMKEVICLDGVSKNIMTPDQLKKTMVSELLAELHIKHTGAFGYKQVDPVCVESCQNVVSFIEGGNAIT